MVGSLGACVMKESPVNQWTISTFVQDDYLLTWVEAFLIDRKAQSMSRGTLDFYRKKLRLFTDFCESQAVTRVSQITPGLLREFLLVLEAKGHNAGGCHAAYRSVRAFLHWWEEEVEPKDWKNPISKVKAPRIGLDPLEPVSIESVTAMIDSCPNSLTGLRDKAIMLFLLDTGVRASELVALDFEDTNQVMGEVLVRRGKGKKPRVVFLGSKSRRALRAYLKLRIDSCKALWITDEGERLSYWGLKMIIRRRAEQAKVKPPQVHAFRRWFALTCLRAGMDVYSLQELMGHADLQVLRRYLKQTNQDVREAHHRASPVDNL
jgi:site-specific recombinase XerD